MTLCVTDKLLKNNSFAMSLREILEDVEKLAEDARKIEPQKFKDTPTLLNTRGVYLIYKKNQVIYIGQGKNLRKRLNQHLSDNEDPKTSTLRRTLIEKCKIKSLETREWLMKYCSISWLQVENPDLCTLVESLLITLFRIRNPKLLNK